MVSALGHALLGLLARGPATGYDLTRAMDRRLAYFWSARHSQVYPELARLEAAGLVEHEVVDGAGPRPTKRYAPTESGMAELLEWILQGPEESVERDSTLLRVSSLWLVDRAAARELVERVRQHSADRLELYREFAAEFEADPAAHDPGRPEFSTRATVEAGLRFHAGRLGWCEWLDQQLGAISPSRARAAARR